ncbi:shikimate dehydrogenase family protein [Parapedobacter sp. 10938]|uniref:shikimate dehydrogenase family protein n=1 Tax=Parapedobacter flavus TaxID=3110225 RepID=UPI002DBFAE77|nr:shikimate dehydrogenase [Parapedobacter sp. 10938]MEC3881525.1 shikimate dehydrogenase [Parapedobacter sp. 10938]
MKKFGLIGFPLAHSFSKKYYDAKIEREHIPDVGYELYPIPAITDFPGLIEKDPLLMGINVTIPYKIVVMDYLDKLSPEAEAIAAVNCIRIERQNGGKPVLSGYNTDVYGFAESLRPLLKPHHDAALVLGNGGAAKAVCYALGQLGIAHTVVSRSPQQGQLAYAQLDATVIGIHSLIINTTPLGTFPHVADCPDIPYHLLDDRHLLYDLVYNPPETAFLKQGKLRVAAIKNGLEMLERQAERNWEIWNAGG